MKNSTSLAGWFDTKKDDPRVIELRQHLTANNGIKGLQILAPDDVDRAVALFHSDGFVGVRDILNSKQV